FLDCSFVIAPIQEKACEHRMYSRVRIHRLHYSEQGGQGLVFLTSPIEGLGQIPISHREKTLIKALHYARADHLFIVTTQIFCRPYESQPHNLLENGFCQPLVPLNDRVDMIEKSLVS